jgi:4-hydroxy-tetrahydrodipicolinate reductase
VIRAIITGAAGRMGSQLIRAVRDAEGVELVGATERPGTAAIGLDAGLAAGLGMLEVQVQDSLDRAIEKAGGKVDVVIDFTTAEASLAHAVVAAEHKVALVVGSTGFSSEAREAVMAASSNIPLVMAPNMSIGVNLLVKIAAEVAEALGADYEVEILEMHHRHKVDAPSGTAVRLAEVIAEKLGRRPERDIVYVRRGATGERPRSQIGVQSLRGGDVVGEHTVYFIGEGERIELTHRAWSRDQFAAGAVRAARWVVGKPAGLYSMRDVLDS